MSASIKAIDTTSVHRIHSGQVVLDLQSCLKELVENALDAGATSIDVRIKDYGTTSIEVVDNGSGIAESDWPYIGLKHHTSKLPELALLPSVDTFGFRGEALSALCALCESVTVVTSTKETEPMGAVIQLGRDGRVMDHTARVAKPRGTTVTLSGLFVPLPVRRKEFERNAKKELTKALSLLTAYALIPASSTPDTPGVRLKVDGITTKRANLLSNDGRGDLRTNVQAVWGSKALDGVTEVDIALDVTIDRMARREGDEAASQTVQVKGLLSSAAWGQGRNAADRQFFYVNGRPADLKSIQKVVNEVYKSFNTNQVPLAILDFIIPRESVDINVSPDKRTIMLHSESNLLSALRIGLESYFAPSRSTFAIEGATQSGKAAKPTQGRLVLPSASTATLVAPEAPEEEELSEEEPEPEAEVPLEPPATISRESPSPPPRASRRIATHSNAEAGPSRTRERGQQVITILDEDDINDPPSQRSRSSSSRSVPTAGWQPPRRPIVATPAISPASPARKRTQGVIDTTTASWSPERKAAAAAKKAKTKGSGQEARKSLRERLKVYSQAEVVVVDDEEEEMEEEEGMDEGSGNGDEDGSGVEAVLAVAELAELADTDTESMDGVGEADNEGAEDGEDAEEGEEEMDLDQGGDEGEGSPTDTPEDSGDFEIDEKMAAPPPPAAVGRSNRRRVASSSPAPSPIKTRTPSSGAANGTASARDLQEYRSEIPSSTTSGEITLSFSLLRLQARYARRARIRSSDASATPSAYPKLERSGVTADAGISNRDAQTAEAALSRVISKPDFGLMEVIGQFNKGFIIARLAKEGGPDDLLIVDQHASDEKFNFETLQRTTQIKGQSLIKPKPLDLTAADELTAIENLPVLRANGFEVDVDEEKPPGRGERIKLVAMPVSKDTVFDFKDLEQLLHLLSDSSHATGQMVRCTKARSMFAMRACRKSVMIGKSLTKGQMTQLVRNMGTIDQPWNCPHGRPTMRHLTKIEAKPETGRRRIDWASWAA